MNTLCEPSAFPPIRNGNNCIGTKLPFESRLFSICPENIGSDIKCLPFVSKVLSLIVAFVTPPSEQKTICNLPLEVAVQSLIVTSLMNAAANCVLNVPSCRVGISCHASRCALFRTCFGALSTIVVLVCVSPSLVILIASVPVSLIVLFCRFSLCGQQQH